MAEHATEGSLMCDLTTKLNYEADCIEEDCNHSSKGHYNAAEKLSSSHRIISLVTVISSTAANIMTFNGLPKLTGCSAILSTGLAAVLTFLKCSEQAESHRAVAGKYLGLKNQTNLFENLILKKMGLLT